MKRLILSAFWCVSGLSSIGAQPAQTPAPAAPVKPAVEPAKPAATAAPAGPAASPSAPAAPAAVPQPAAPVQALAPAAPAEEESPLTAEQREVAAAMVAKPVSGEELRVYGWREYVMIQGVPEKLSAKLDTGARTSSIHAEERELFERDGKKWVRFVVTDPTVEKSFRVRLEAPLTRVVNIKEPGGPSVAREVVKLNFKIGDRSFSGEFSLSNRNNMLAPVLIGRSQIMDLGIVDVRRAYIADEKILMSPR